MFKFLSIFLLIPVCYANDQILQRDQSILFMQKVLPVPMALLKVRKINALEIYDLAKSFAVLDKTTNIPVFVAIVIQNLAKILQQYGDFNPTLEVGPNDQIARSQKLTNNNMVLQLFLWLSATALTDKQVQVANLKLQDHDLEIRSIFKNLMFACEDHLTRTLHFIGVENLSIFEKIQEVFKQISDRPNRFRMQLESFYKTEST